MFFASLFSFWACSTQNTTQEVIRLSWEEGQEFKLATSRRMIANKTEESAVTLDVSSTGNTFEDLWSEELVWSYRVVETDVYPGVDDQLYPYSIASTGEQVPLSVLKVTLDPSLNGDASMIELDPVTYLVFTSKRNRLAGVIQFINVDGERVETAYSSEHINASWSVLSQSSLSMVPTYLSPYGARWEGGERNLENGSFLVAEKQDDTHTDVLFEDVMGGEVVATRYQEGMPWPTWTVSSNLTARMLSDEEISEIRANVPAMRPDTPEDFDYRAALTRSIRLDDAQVLSSEDLASGEIEMIVGEDFRPWAGYWWPLKKGELVFGYESSRESYSSLIREQVDPIKEAMDGLSGEIRELRKDESKKEEMETKQEEFQTKQKELIDILVEFYGGFLQDLDAHSFLSSTVFCIILLPCLSREGNQ